MNDMNNWVGCSINYLCSLPFCCFTSLAFGDGLITGEVFLFQQVFDKVHIDEAFHDLVPMFLWEKVSEQYLHIFASSLRETRK